MNSKVVKCHLCGTLYKTYLHMVGDQSCCPACRRKADQNERKEFNRWEGRK